MSRRHYACPKCDQKTGVKIVYGYPDDELVEESQRGEIILGGCMQLLDDPDRQCLECGHQWSKALGRT